MAWGATKTRMTADGSNDLVLDAGASWGSYEYASTDAGSVAYYHVDLDFRIEESPASQEQAEYKLEIDTSADNIVWAGYMPFQPGTYYFRYFKFKATVYGNPASAQRPKITRFEHIVTPADEHPHMGQVTALQNSPPASPTIGVRYVVGSTGAGAWTGYDKHVAICIESTTPTWRLIPPSTGMRVYRIDTEEEWRYTNNAEWQEADVLTSCHGHIAIHGYDYSAVGAGTWAITIDVAQIHNGYLDNTAAAANLDNVSYATCLKVGTYTLNLHTTEGPSHGIVDIDLIIGSSTSEVASFDCYAAGGAKNIKKAQTSISITKAGLYELKARVDGKNVASAGYDAYIELITLFRTA